MINKHKDYIYRKKYYLIGETGLCAEGVSLTKESITVEGETVEKTLEVDAEDLRELSLDDLDEDIKERLGYMRELEEVYVMPESVYEKMLTENTHDLFNLPTNYMNLLN